MEKKPPKTIPVNSFKKATDPGHAISLKVVSLEDLQFALSQLEWSAAVVVRRGEGGAGPEKGGDHRDVGGAGG